MSLDPRLLVRRRRLALGLIAAAAIAAPGCEGDGGEDLATEDSLRDCLTDAGLTVRASELGASAGLAIASPDFSVSASGQSADVIVEGSPEKADETAADVQGAQQSLGAAGSVVMKERNAVVVFAGEPAGAFREQIEGCL